MVADSPKVEAGQPMKQSVILVDDEHLAANYYYWALRNAGFEVLAFDDIDMAVEHLERMGDTAPAMLIFDVMMPPGRSFAADDTSEGLLAGLFLYRWARQRWPNLPVIALTHAQLTSLSCLHDDSLAEAIAKVRCPPMDLVDVVRKAIGSQA